MSRTLDSKRRSVGKAVVMGMVLAMGMTTAAFAQSLQAPKGFPQRQITIVSPFPPGGGNDTISRLVANELAKIVGVPVVVDNRGGAGGNVGTASAAKADPDGHTILTAQTSIIGLTSSPA